jgi:hypothetical protein
MHFRSRPNPVSDATRREVRGKLDAPSKGLSRASYDDRDGRKGREKSQNITEARRQTRNQALLHFEA